MNDFVNIGSIINKDNLHKILGKYRRHADTELAQIFSRWEEAVGEAIAKNVKPSEFKGKLLILNVDSPVWIHALQFQKEDIIAKINETLEKDLVEEIELRVGPV